MSYFNKKYIKALNYWLKIVKLFHSSKFYFKSKKI